MSDFDLKKEVEEVKQIKSGAGALSWAKRKVLEVYGNACKYPKTAFAVGVVLGFVAAKVLF